jgi:hypothetical protein
MRHRTFLTEYLEAHDCSRSIHSICRIGQTYSTVQLDCGYCIARLCGSAGTLTLTRRTIQSMPQALFTVTQLLSRNNTRYVPRTPLRSRLSYPIHPIHVSQAVAGRPSDVFRTVRSHRCSRALSIEQDVTARCSHVVVASDRFAECIVHTEDPTSDPRKRSCAQIGPFKV